MKSPNDQQPQPQESVFNWTPSLPKENMPRPTRPGSRSKIQPNRKGNQKPTSVPATSTETRVVQLEYFPDTDPVSPDRLRSITDPEGQVVEFAYDLRGRLTNTTTLRPTRGDLEASYQYDDTDRLYLESIHGLLYRTHDRSETITVGGPRTLITTIPFAPNGAPLHDEERNEHFVRRQFGRISQHHINYNLELPT